LRGAGQNLSRNRERFRLKRQVGVHTAQGRLTGWILTFLPVVLGFALYMINPEMMSLLWTRAIGIKLLWAARHHDCSRRFDHPQNCQPGYLRVAYGICNFSFPGGILLILSGGLLLFYREAMLQRITEVINPQGKQKSLLSAIQQTGLSICGVVEHSRTYCRKARRKSRSSSSASSARAFARKVRSRYFMFQGLGFRCCSVFGYGQRTGQRGGVFCVRHVPGSRISSARFLAGQENQEAPKQNSARPPGCARSSCHLHRGWTEPGPGNGARGSGVG